VFVVGRQGSRVGVGHDDTDGLLLGCQDIRKKAWHLPSIGPNSFSRWDDMSILGSNDAETRIRCFQRG
jgi:hypothetical protein